MAQKLATFQDPIFQNEDAAREALEAVLWPDGVICRHCGNSDPDSIAKMEGKSHRKGLYYCNECKGQFTVTVGTVFERSKAPLTNWWMAAHLLNQGKNGASAHGIHRQIRVTYNTAWFMMHRLREAMADLKPADPFGPRVRKQEPLHHEQRRELFLEVQPRHARHLHSPRASAPTALPQ